jgi:acyl-CoA thioesterase-1
MMARSLRARLCGIGAAAHRASYGSLRALVQTLTLLAVVLGAAAAEPVRVAAGDPVRVVAFGDSLMSGHGLPAHAAFPARLEDALRKKGIAAEVANAGVSGDTVAAGLARLDWSVPEGSEAVILALGANDMLRGIDPEATRRSLAEMLRRLSQRGIPVLVAGMRAAPNLGADYGRRFEAIYPELAAEHGAIYYPFLLDGVAAERTLNQRDGIHPTAGGIEVMVERMLPKVEELVARARARRGG